MADLLNRQTEPADEADLDSIAERFAGYIQGEPWSSADRRFVWTSPAARVLYLNMRATNGERVARRWAERGFANELTLRAADGDGGEHVIREAGITVRILRAPAMNDWLISVLLSEDATDLLAGEAFIRVTDSGGKVWLEGSPDRTGTLDGYWEDQTQTPAERLRSFSLRLDFH